MHAGVFPLLSNKPELVEFAKTIYDDLKNKFICSFDKSGSIGKRYARNDEIGTPYCITVDFDSLENKDVTVRDRNSTAQKRIKIDDLSNTLYQLISGEISFKNLK